MRSSENAIKELYSRSGKESDRNVRAALVREMVGIVCPGEEGNGITDSVLMKEAVRNIASSVCKSADVISQEIYSCMASFLCGVREEEMLIAPKTEGVTPGCVATT